MNRKLAREAVYLMIFSYLFTGELTSRVYRNLDVNALNVDDLSLPFDATLNGEFDAKDLEYIDRVSLGVVEHEKELKGYIVKFSKGFVLDRVYKPDLAILMLAIYEMIYEDSIPLKVSISEAVTIVKKYSTTKSFSFVNGLLASVYKELTEEKNGADN